MTLDNDIASIPFEILGSCLPQTLFEVRLKGVHQDDDGEEKMGGKAPKALYQNTS